ncbi:MAG: tRNA (N(6)-L-threonylcarbamoyladenosine(37)-C(2))-methylthiotransferase, partial [Candidatus Heimdallarchaeota archaeon]
MEKNSFYIETYGCTSNKADSYIISNILKKNNYSETNLNEAEFLIINTCAVKQQTENKIKTRLKNLYKTYKNRPDKHLIIAGCLPHIEPGYINEVKKLVPSFSAIIDLDNINKIPEIFKQIKNGKKNLIVKSTEKIDKAKILLDFPKNKITGILPISEGCLGSCTYCCVKNARGKLNCYNPESVIENARHQLKQNIKQIYLTSQDCSTYQYNNTNLFNLVKVINDLDFKFFLRIGMLNPIFLIKDLNQMISIYNLNKVYKLLHIPIQSGSDKILKKMNRFYSISEIHNKINILKNKFPLLTFSTDIICGFPGETEEDFNETIKLIKWLKPEILNISKFTPRPGTKAKNMNQVNSRTIKERSIRLSKIFRESLINMNKHWAGWEGEVL